MASWRRLRRSAMLVRRANKKGPSGPFPSVGRTLRVQIPHIDRAAVGMERRELGRLAFRTGRVGRFGHEVVGAGIFDALRDVAAPGLVGVALDLGAGIEGAVVCRRFAGPALTAVHPCCASAAGPDEAATERFGVVAGANVMGCCGLGMRPVGRRERRMRARQQMIAACLPPPGTTRSPCEARHVHHQPRHLNQAIGTSDAEDDEEESPLVALGPI